jgi:uncharacterized protein (DUF362 family)|tara:strand:- start:226 stop:1350 length:1125 start_codon:yes stop_codon:yes gene_type:complete
LTKESLKKGSGQKTVSKKSIVAVLNTSPETVIDDYARLLDLARIQDTLNKTKTTFLKVNVSWQHYYPACSSAPWQIEGVGKKLISEGFSDIISAHNGTVVVDPREGREKNKHSKAENRLGIDHLILDEPPVKWIPFSPKSKMLVLDKVYPEGLFIPEIFIGTNIIHLPTVKTHVFTKMTGAMKNAFGGLLHRNRHWTHSVIHETLVDLLQIQKEIHSGIFAVMDGTFAGDGPGPRAMRVHEKNIIIASSDQVAIDAVASKLMGFDPMLIPKLKIAHEMGLGTADTRLIEYKGDDVSNVNWNFSGNDNTFASRGQKLIYHGPLKPLEGILLRSPIAPWAYLASNFYHNGFWRPIVGKNRLKKAMKTRWGKLFCDY